MDNDEQQHLTEEMAARLWRRAVDLQAEAAGRAETTPLLAAEREGESRDSTGYSFAHVRQAAEEAGIAGEFVDAALGRARRTILKTRRDIVTGAPGGSFRASTNYA
jgi:hypothetical protein